MRKTLKTMTLAAVLVVGVGALGACSSDVEEPAADAAPTSTEAPAPTAIEATGTLLNGPPGSVERQPDGSETGVSHQELQGDLVGDLETESHWLVDYGVAPITFTVFESTGTFTGTIEGVGSGTLTFTTSAPENVYDENTATVESGTVSGGTGDLAGYEGTVELTYTLLFGGAIEDGTYTVDLEHVG